MAQAAKVTDPKEPSILYLMQEVMAEVQSVGKTGKNTAQNYSFRGVDAVVNAVGPALRKFGVVIMPTVEEANYRDVEVGKNKTPQRECTLRVRYTFYGPAGDSIEAVVYAEALDSGDKATAKAHSVAYRTCLLQALTIPTDEPDPDEHSAERAAVEKPRAPEAVVHMRGVVRAALAQGQVTKEALAAATEKLGYPPSQEQTAEQLTAVLAEAESQMEPAL